MAIAELPSHQENENKKSAFAAVENLSYTYPETETPVLSDISFTLDQGELVSLHGTSGSGKTTLLYTLSGMIPHVFKGGDYAGQVTLGQKDVSDPAMLSAVTRETAFITQNPSEQTFGRNVEDVIAFGMENQNIPRDEMNKRMDEITSQLSIQHLLGRNIRTLSGGEAQATVIASMLARRPSLMLFDEVMSALDPAAAARVKKITQELSRQGITVLLSDSDSSWAKDTVDRSLLLHEGRLVYDGNPEDIEHDQDLAEVAGLGLSESGVIFRERNIGKEVAQVEDVTFKYGEKPVLEHVSFTLPDSACTAIIGHNGSGKSTLGRLLAGYMGPQEGSLSVNGKRIKDLPAAQAVREVSYLFQRPSQMFTEPTVAQDFLLSCKELGIDPAVSLADFGLDGMEDLPPSQLSTGQQQRLAQAATFAINPNLLILDEPTRGQTRQERDRLVDRIEARSDTDKATVLITHDMNLAVKAADYVVVLDHGKVIRQDRASEVFADEELFDRLGFELPQLQIGGEHGR